jgi:hypothetical protein
VKHRRLGPGRALGVRAAVELCLAATRTLIGSLAFSVEAFVGQFDDAGARRNLEFFQTRLLRAHRAASSESSQTSTTATCEPSPMSSWH